jgi:NADH:ubiquinone oxidoreductase subunit K
MLRRAEAEDRRRVLERWRVESVVGVLLGIELMLNAANINLVAFSKQLLSVNGQVFAMAGASTT